MNIDFSKYSDAQLKRLFTFHDNDRGTTTFEQECRRMYILQETGLELQRRGIDNP